MEDLSKRDIEYLEKDCKETIKALGLEELKAELFSLEKESIEENFWNNAEHAKRVMNRISHLKDITQTAQRLNKDIFSLVELFNSIEKETEQNRRV